MSVPPYHPRPSPAKASLALLPELDQRPAPRRRFYHGILAAFIALVAIALLGSLFAASFLYQSWADTHRSQITTHAPAPEPDDLAAYHSFASQPPAGTPAPIVLAYHNIAPDTADGRYSVTPERFDAQMRMLSEAGYQTLSVDQFVDYIEGSWHPSGRSVLVTFDDGTAGLWTYADTTLRRYHDQAVSFLITADVGESQPYYLTWRQIEKMHASGRWSFGSHTNAQHTREPTGVDGKKRPILSNRLFQDGHRESLAAYKSRVQSDLTTSKTAMMSHGLPAPRLFAWPFSSLVHKASDPPAARIVRSLVHEMFVANFSNPASNPQPASQRSIATGVMQRLEVMRSTTARELFDQLKEMQTFPPAAAPAPLSKDVRWVSSTGETAQVRVHGDTLSTPSQSSRYERLDWAPQRTADWQNYSVSVTVTGLDSGGATGGLRVRVGSSAELALRVSANRATVQDAAGHRLRTFPITEGSGHTLTMAVAAQSTKVYVDGTLLTKVSADSGPLNTGGIGVVSSRPEASVPFPEYVGFHVSAAKSN